MDDQSSSPSLKDSEKNINQLYNQQLQISKAFQPSNFYLNERFNLKELKQKLQYRKQQQYIQNTLKAHHTLIKPTYHLSPPPQDTPIINQPKTIQSNGKNRNYHVRSGKQRLTQKQEGRNYILANKQVKSYDHSARQPIQQRYSRAQSTNQRITQTKKQPFKLIKHQNFNKQSRQYSTLLPRQKSVTPFYQPLQRKIKSRLIANKTEGEQSRFSGVQTQQSFHLSIQGKIIISSSSQLLQLQTKIMILWQHYELLTRILEIIQRDVNKTKLHISKYRDTVCSPHLEFISEMLAVLCNDPLSKKQGEFFKRLKKGVVISRLYQHLSIIFLALSFYSSLQITHLSNMIGYASSNLGHLIRLLVLSHRVQSPLKMSQSIEEKILVITSFEMGSYKKELTTIPDVLMRIEQSNNIMGVIRSKLEVGKDFNNYLIHNYLKNYQSSHSFQQYAHSIFEFLALILARNSFYGVLECAEMAPSPYLVLEKPRTVVIQPWEVLLCMKGEATFVRAYSQQFLREVGQHCNIVYWTELLPEQIDGLLEKMPPGFVLYRYHCKYRGFVKLLERLGSDLDNTIIIDRTQANFRQNKEMGIELPWVGRRRDLKLLNFLQTLQFIFQQKTTFRQGFARIKPDMKKQSFKKDRLERSYGMIRHNMEKMRDYKH